MRQMKGHGAKFERKKEQAIAALLTSKSVKDAARALELNPNTLLRWLQIPEFRTDCLKARRESVYQSVARMQQATGATGITILKIMTDPNLPAAVRLRAAEYVFEIAMKRIELEDIDTRLAALEAAAPMRIEADEKIRADRLCAPDPITNRERRLAKLEIVAAACRALMWAWPDSE